jgi:hypothetical protein
MVRRVSVGHSARCGRNPRKRGSVPLFPAQVETHETATDYIVYRLRAWRNVNDMPTPENPDCR